MSILKDTIQLITSVIGAIGGILGIISWVSGKRREKRLRQEEDDMWKLYDQIRHTFEERGGNAIRFEIGSQEYKLAERLVERKLLRRSPDGKGFMLATWLG